MRKFISSVTVLGITAAVLLAGAGPASATDTSGTVGTCHWSKTTGAVYQGSTLVAYSRMTNISGCQGVQAGINYLVGGFIYQSYGPMSTTTSTAYAGNNNPYNYPCLARVGNANHSV